MKKNGIHTEYYENGEKKFEGSFKNGKKDGLFTWWYENGQKEYEGLYEDGRKISVEEWNEDGSVKKSLNEMPLVQIKENKMKFRRLLSYKLDNDSKAMGSIVLGFLIVAIIYIAYKLLT